MTIPNMGSPYFTMVNPPFHSLGRSTHVRRRFRRPLLLQGLIFSKSQSHPLRHFNIPIGTVFNTGGFGFVQGFGTEGIGAGGKTSID